MVPEDFHRRLGIRVVRRLEPVMHIMQRIHSSKDTTLDKYLMLDITLGSLWQTWSRLSHNSCKYLSAVQITSITRRVLTGIRTAFSTLLCRPVYRRGCRTQRKSALYISRQRRKTETHFNRVTQDSSQPLSHLTSVFLYQFACRMSS